MRESDDACLVMSAAIHSGARPLPLQYVMTPATPVLLTWSGLPVPGRAVFAVWAGPRRATQGREAWAKLCRIQYLSSHVRLCESGCVCEQQL